MSNVILLLALKKCDIQSLYLANVCIFYPWDFCYTAFNCSMFPSNTGKMVACPAELSDIQIYFSYAV